MSVRNSRLLLLFGAVVLLVVSALSAIIIWTHPAPPRRVQVSDPAPVGYDIHRPVPPIQVSIESRATACADTDTHRVQILYVHPTGTDRYATYLNSFLTWVTQADGYYNVSANLNGGTRHIRFVQDANCVPTVLNVAVAGASLVDMDSMTAALAALGYNRADRKYVSFVDAVVYCGISTFWADDQLGAANANNTSVGYSRIDLGCWSGVISAHELMHALGAVQASAPLWDGGYHCTFNYDNMCDHTPAGIVNIICPDPAGDSLFDCTHNNYFAPFPTPGSYLETHWNAANSLFLMVVATPTPRPTPVNTPTSRPTLVLSQTPRATPVNSPTPCFGNCP